jgi:ATP-dependent helicase/nuclease subunit A
MADLFTLSAPASSNATGNNNPPPDWKQREHALDVRQSWIVEAPAGSGKTELLIQRYLKLLADDSVEEPEQVLAITFTVKATTEIRERIGAQLESASRSEPLKRDSLVHKQTRALADAVLQRDKLLRWHLLEHPRRLNLRTIDSVCAEIAHSLPVLSGGGGQSPVLDASLLYRDAARHTLMQLGGPDEALNDALHTVLLHRDGNLAECERLLAEMLEWRDQWGQLVPLGRKKLDDAYLDGTVLPKLERALEQAVCAGLTEFANSVPQGFLHALSSLATSLAEIEPYGREHSPIAICANKLELPSNNAADLEHWRALIHLLVTPSSGTWRKSFAKNTMGFEVTQNQKKNLKRLLDEVAHRDDLLRSIEKVNRLPPAIYPQEQWIVAKALFRVLSRALAELQLVFTERNECDFAELGLLAKTALRREGGVDDLSSALGMKLQHLLVDEMQDTSTGQYELIRLLTHGWDGQSQTVFLVGDPKQSIYLFRQARVERFVRTMHTGQLGDLPLKSLQLTANFRSQSKLVDEFNADFSLLFPHEVSAANPEEVAYVAAESVNGPSQNEGLGVVWHTHVLPSVLEPDDARHEKRRHAKRDAQRVRAIVQQWRSRPLPQNRTEPWKIAVLVRSRSHLIDIVAALKDQKEGSIPFHAIDIELLRDRPEVLDLSALTRALLHPADRVAWLAVLHAPWCGLGLADLHLLTGADDPAWAERCMQDVIDERADLLSEDSCERLARIWTVLRAAAEQRAKLTISQWVERTWRSLGGDVYLTSDELANAKRYLYLLDELEQQEGTINSNLLKRRINKLYAETTAVAGAVDLMTIHGAKGLEWDVVIVPNLEKKARVNREKLLTWSEIDSNNEEAASIVLAPITGKGEGSQELNSWLKAIDKTREAAERKRLFYVACTRAREELHLFATPEAKSNGEISRPAGSLLSTIWPAAQRHFSEIASAPETTENIFIMTPTAPTTDGFIGDIAAEMEEEEETLKPAKLQRLPLSFNPRSRFQAQTKLVYGDLDNTPTAAHFARPEGSFKARAFGNAVHTFLEVLSKRLGEGVQPTALRQEVGGWSSRLAAVLRGNGLPSASVEKLTLRAKSALSNVLQDAEGLWLLGAQDEASSEYSLITWQEKRNSVRLDRIFRAGRQPLASGDDCLWVVDYKTTAHGYEGIEEFLAAERLKYEPQMNAYAQVVQSTSNASSICIGLYYPMLPRFIWWNADTNETKARLQDYGAEHPHPAPRR